jgi:cobalamin biosynthetic protein CobC
MPSAGAATLAHGGDLTAARSRFPDAPEPFVDLSTGINPKAYPVPPLDGEILHRLPQADAIQALCAVAAQTYGAPSEVHVVAAPGTQILLPIAAALVPPGRAAIRAPTYSEHARIARLAGHSVVEVGELAHLAAADLAIIVNPNNPDGRFAGKTALLAIADTLRSRGGLLLVDETFMDVATAGESLAAEVDRGNIVVLRSFGKFFGLPGLRLGFAIAAADIAARIAAWLGPWAVSGPAIVIGQAALRDRSWVQASRETLARSAHRLDGLLTDAGLHIVGGTSLFRLARTQAAAELFERLGRAGILVRRFGEEPSWLRFGIPGGEDAWARLRAALLKS